MRPTPSSSRRSSLRETSARATKTPKWSSPSPEWDGVWDQIHAQSKIPAITIRMTKVGPSRCKRLGHVALLSPRGASHILESKNAFRIIMIRIYILCVSNSRVHVGCIVDDISYVSAHFLRIESIYCSLLVVDFIDKQFPPVIVHNGHKPLMIGHLWPPARSDAVGLGVEGRAPRGWGGPAAGRYALEWDGAEESTRQSSPYSCYNLMASSINVEMFQRPFVDDPSGAAGDGEGVRTDVSHVFAECLSHMREGRPYTSLS